MADFEVSREEAPAVEPAAFAADRDNWHDSQVSRVETTLLSVALAGVITLAAYADVILVAAAIVVAQFMIAAAPAPSDENGRHINCPRFVPALVAAAIATVITLEPRLLVGAEGTRSGTVGYVSSGLLSAILLGSAAGLFFSILGQMLRTDGRTSLVSSLSYATTLCVFAALPVGWIGTAQSLGGEALVTLGAVAVAAALLVWLIPGNRVLLGAAGVVAAGAAAAGTAVLVDGPDNMGALFGAILGLGIGMFAILGQVLGRAWSQGRGHSSSGWGFAGAMSFALSAPVLFIGSQFLGTALLR